jgi:serine/threonine-protein kinase Stk1
LEKIYSTTTISKCKWNGRGGVIIVAVKKIKLLNKNENLKNLIEREIKILTNIRHENIIKFYGRSFDENTNSFYILMEYVDGVSLFSLLQGDEKKNDKIEISWDLKKYLLIKQK